MPSSMTRPLKAAGRLTADEPIDARARPDVQGCRGELEPLKAHRNAADVSNTTNTTPSDAAMIRP